MRASKQVPKIVLKHKSRRRLWQRREVGIRVPDCAVVQHITRELDEPLLSSSADDGPTAVWSTQRDAVDFIVAGSTNMANIWDEVADEAHRTCGKRIRFYDQFADVTGVAITLHEEDRISSVVDLTMEYPVVRRQGLGDTTQWEALAE
ncbi:unnamed protein product [Prorocentrum cordatum]|uniref:Uncharacterized protein n=1 Tax=Prorocentrum cordatum TaxID=2364126 RepID=A0ABN9Y1Q2_9DINO|nr:unnamed protein product [Polarella glacialis]